MGMGKSGGCPGGFHSALFPTGGWRGTWSKDVNMLTSYFGGCDILCSPSVAV